LESAAREARRDRSRRRTGDSEGMAWAGMRVRLVEGRRDADSDEGPAYQFCVGVVGEQRIGISP
jgi:hypothetical protein